MKSRKSKIISIIAGTAIMCTALLNSDCAASDEPIHCEGFQAISSTKEINGMIIFEVIDNNTGVHYYYGDSGSSGVFMTPVYDSEGKVKVSDTYER